MQEAVDGEILAADTAAQQEPTEGMPVEEAAALSQAPAAEPPADELPDEPVQVPAEVEVHRADVIVRGLPPSAAPHQAFDVPGVEHLSGVSRFDASIVGPDGTAEVLQVMAVDPATFRPLTPAVTAQEPAVWQRLVEGDVVVRHDVAHNLGLELGSDITLTGPVRPQTVRIGAFASNGAPPLADLIVPWDVGSDLGGGDVDTLIVALRDDVDPPASAEAITAAVGGGEAEVREAPVRQQAARIVGTGGRTHFEPFSYTDLGDGMIVIDPAWVKKWIVPVEIPGMGTTRVHRIMAPQLMAALREVQEAGLYGHFKKEQFAGAWVPRHIDWRPDRPLSMHAWGLAIDFNAQDNWLGKKPVMDVRIVRIFEKWGFQWGGWWNRPDGMHFELARVVQVG
ncbi:MAG: M15 family metallopeptidase [Actinobacteria bacterium]|nr:M15 family metallopeptidase [Actinomycetota bacterium]